MNDGQKLLRATLRPLYRPHGRKPTMDWLQAVTWAARRLGHNGTWRVQGGHVDAGEIEKLRGFVAEYLAALPLPQRDRGPRCARWLKRQAKRDSARAKVAVAP